MSLEESVDAAPVVEEHAVAEPIAVEQLRRRSGPARPVGWPGAS